MPSPPKHPASDSPFLDVRVRDVVTDPTLRGLCVGYECGVWRQEAFARHVIEWLPEFALDYSEREAIGHHNCVKTMGKAAESVYTSDKYKKRGEFGEIFLHIALRQDCGSTPAISKLYFKSANNDPVKGFDAVHVVGIPGDLELWLGEVKFYEDIADAKNVIIFDNKVARRDVDFFTFNNIKGRAGRMFQHFVGHVYLFADPPQEDLPLVDLPLVTQGSDTPASLLVQMDAEDLKPDAARRLEPFRNQNVLPLDIMRQNSAVEPQAQLDAANAIAAMPAAEVVRLTWTSFPKYKELQKTCEVIWEFLVPQNRRSSVFSAAQLTMKVWQLQKSPDVPGRVMAELTTGGRFAAKSPDEAVERVLSFDRNWASFELPRYLMALFRIQAHVLPKRGIKPGNYSFYAQRLESLFRAPVLSALDEYGIPPTIGEKLLPVLGTEDDLDVALAALRRPLRRVSGLSRFEQSVVEFARSGL